jgi:CBS-domain-containing membrane protein
MLLTHSVHPPGGASALIAVIGSERIHEIGFQYVISPVGVGATALLVVAFVTNNISRKNPWPLFWFPFQIPRWRFWK